MELRLLLNEQVILEKLKSHPQSAQEAMQAAMQGPDRQQLDECEKTFTEVVLTRLLVRPDAAALYSEVVHLLGKALEDYLILHVSCSRRLLLPGLFSAFCLCGCIFPDVFKNNLKCGILSCAFIF